MIPWLADRLEDLKGQDIEKVGSRYSRITMRALLGEEGLVPVGKNTGSLEEDEKP